MALDYDARGNPIGESPFGANGARATPAYRNVTAMSSRGQVTAQQFGNGTVENDVYDAATWLVLSMQATGLREPAAAPCQTAPITLVKQLDYKYDQILNLKSQQKQLYQRDANGVIKLDGACNPLGASVTETYSYDDLQRLLSGSRAWTGISVAATNVPRRS